MSLNFRQAFVTLAASDMEKMLAFYSQLLGRQPDAIVGQVYAEFKLPGLRLGIFQPKYSHRQEFESKSSGSMSLCLEVDDLERAIAHLGTLGYPPTWRDYKCIPRQRNLRLRSPRQPVNYTSVGSQGCQCRADKLEY